MEIDVCYALYDPSHTYCRYIGASICSLLENTKEKINIHLLHDDTLSDDNRNKLLRLISNYDQNIYFYNISELMPEELLNVMNKVAEILHPVLTVGAFYRLFISYILPEYITKCIYLDADTIINLDIVNLWMESIDGYAIAAVPENEATINHIFPVYMVTSGIVKKEDYLNSGVLVLNLEILRQKKDIITSGLKFLIENRNCKYLDQDILNYLFSTCYKKLSNIYNIFVKVLRNGYQLKTDKYIFHFAAHAANVFPYNDPWSNLWIHYLSLTPWFNVKYVKNILKNISYIITDNRVVLQKVLGQWGEKDFVICIEPFFKDVIKALLPFAFNSEVYILPSESELEKLNVFTTYVQENIKNKIFVIVTRLYPIIRVNLLNVRLIEGENFFNGGILLPMELGGCGSIKIDL